MTNSLSRFFVEVVALVAAACCVSAAADPGVQVLFDFSAGPDLSRIAATDARTAVVPSGGGAALRVMTGHAQPWPGVTLRGPAGPWDLSAYGQVEVSVSNTGAQRVTLYCRVDNAGADGTNHCVTGSLDLASSQSGLLKVPLKRATDSQLDGRLFGMRGYPVAAGGPGTIDANGRIQPQSWTEAGQ